MNVTTAAAPSADTPTSPLLAQNYQPCSNTVIIGRGRQIQNHPGNRRLQDLVQQASAHYTAASATRDVKTEIIARVVQVIRNQSLGGIGFVKYDKVSGRWMQLEESMARSAVGQAFRDLLQGYRSSKQSKQAKRLLEKKAQGLIVPISAVKAGNIPTRNAEPPVRSIHFRRVVSLDEAVEQTTAVTPKKQPDPNDQSCFDRLYALVAMEQPTVLQGDPFEPRPLPGQDTRIDSKELQGTSPRANRAHRYISMLKKAGIKSVPMPSLVPHAMAPGSISNA